MKLREIEIREDPRLRKNFEIRSRANLETHLYFQERGYVETETPVLTPELEIAPIRQFSANGGGRPFLRMTDTEFLRRLLVGGFDKIYQLSKHFRVGDLNFKSYPEFTQLSLAVKGTDYIQLAHVVGDYMIHVAERINGSTNVDAFGQELDLREPWRILSVKDALGEFANVDLDDNLEVNALEETLRRMKMPAPPEAADYSGVIRYTILMENLLDKQVIPNFKGVLFLNKYPYELGGPGKEVETRPGYKQRGEIFFNGIELLNSVSTQTDGEKLRRRYQETLDLQIQSGKWDGKRLDEEYLSSIESGIPESAVMSLGYDRFLMMLTKSKNIRDVIMFPVLDNGDK
jgi:lysyl-tRNA synthetase class 2